MLTAEQIAQGLELLQKERVIRRRGRPEVLPPAVVREGERLQLSETYLAERDIARHLRRLMAGAKDALSLPEGAFGDRTPDESQRAAAEMAMVAGALVMTGGPGVGKTTVTRAIIAGYEDAGLQVVCCAPTGKAALRMAEQTGREAATIHATIGLVPGQRPAHDDSPAETDEHGRTRGGPIVAGAVVVDEASMIDVRLMAALLRAIPTGARLLIVGDVDQLPSIGAGRVLYDIIAAQTVPVVRLTKIHRQASESRIPYVARDVNAGRVPSDLHQTGTDFTHWESADAEVVADRIVRAVADSAQSISARRGIPLHDVQVLAPQYKGPAGVEVLNARLQAELNPSKGDKSVYANRGYEIRTGDRVIHTRNNYDLNVMNGEMGYIVAHDVAGLPFDSSVHWSGKADEAMSEEGEDGEEGSDNKAWSPVRVLIVEYAHGRRVAYTAQEARELELGYCVTVHKSQGSQFGAVIVTLAAQSAYMMTRPLLYTAITRAEKLCLTVGTEVQLARAAGNTRGTERRTTLRQRLTDTDADA